MSQTTLERVFKLQAFRHGQWLPLDINEFAGGTFRSMLLILDTTPVVGKVTSEKGEGYFAGTPELCAALKAKGYKNVMTFSQFLTLMERVDSNVLDATCPKIVNILGGTIESFVAHDAM